MGRLAGNEAVKRALRLYDHEPLGIRAFVRARHLLCPLAAIEQFVPDEGRILDLGCGHGLLSATMAIASSERTVLGVDPSPAKLATAARLSGKLPNASFRLGTIAAVQEPGLDAITILDVLYLLPVEEKSRILVRCRELLAPDGRLILKTNDTHPGWKFRWAWLQEVAMTRLGLTMGEHRLYFLSCTEHQELLRQAGFGRVETFHLPFALPYPHTLLLCSP